MRYATCHPEKQHFAKGLCRNCYYQQHDRERNQQPERKAIRDERSREAYRRKKGGVVVPRDTRPRRVPDCHPDRYHYARGLCTACYEALNRTPSFGMATCHPDKPHVARGLCATCYSNARDARKAEEERDKQHSWRQQAATKLRAEMLAAFGPQCACPQCPETNPAFLTLDHIGGGGIAHRKEVNSGGGFLYRIRNEGWPKDKYRLLCWNCNAMTRGGRICPHMESENA